MLVKGDRSRGLEQLPVQGGEDADVVVGAGGGADDAGVLVDGLEELADDEGHRLDPLDLLLGVQVLLLQVALLVLDVLLLDRQELKLLLQFLVLGVQVVQAQVGAAAARRRRRLCGRGGRGRRRRPGVLYNNRENTLSKMAPKQYSGIAFQLHIV